MPEFSNLESSYRELELAPGATFEQVRSAYRILVKTWHPDRWLGDPAMRDRAEARLRAINGAFETLEKSLASASVDSNRDTKAYPVTPEPPPQSPQNQERPSQVTLFPKQFREGWGYVDHAGRVTIPGPFGYAGEFRGGLALIASGRVASLAKFGYLAPTGEIAIPFQFDGATDFHEGRAAVRVKTRWGYIDRSGKFAVLPRFQAALEFSEGIAPIREGGLWGYIDLDGTYVVAPRFESAKPFVSGWGVVTIGRRLARVNQFGDIQLFHERFSK